MAVNLNDFIRVYDDVLDLKICNFLIDFFEENSNLHERVENNSRPNFTQLNLTENYNITEKVNAVHNYLISKVYEYKNKYYQLFDPVCFPKKHNFEQFRIKKYFPEKGDQFDTHVDVLDYSSSRRYLAFLWYLNDVSVGGETTFENLSIVPKAGSMLVFPPVWLFPHKGNPPISNTKYIMSTYLHYT